MAVEYPLGRIIGVGFGQAVGVFFLCDFCPVVEVERDFDQRGVGDIQLLVNAPHLFVVFRRRTEAPDGGDVARIIRNNWR